MTEKYRPNKFSPEFIPAPNVRKVQWGKKKGKGKVQ